MVSNLPFGRQVRVGGKGGDGKRGDCTEAELEPLLVALRDLAPRHAFVTGAPVAATTPIAAHLSHGAPASSTSRAIVKRLLQPQKSSSSETRTGTTES